MKVEVASAKDIDFKLIPRVELDLHAWSVIGDCYKRSDERWIGTVDNKIACMWGLIPPTFLSNVAYIWLYHNQLVEDHKFLFIRHSQRHMEVMLRIYPNIEGDCLIGNASGLQWLKWLGADFGMPNSHFIPFKIRAKHG